MAVVDGASFVLPYDVQLVTALAEAGADVDLYASETRYNGALLAHLGTCNGVAVEMAAVSRTAARRWRGVLNYLTLWWRLWRRRRRYAVINLQFAPLGGLELPLWWLLRSQLVFTVHNPVPHGHRAARHGPTAALARMARALVFASAASRDDFLRRYGAGWGGKCVVMPHGLLPVAPGDPAAPYQPLAAPRAVVFWGNVQAYKGVELFEELARDPLLRARGVALEVHGAWAPEMRALAQRLRDAGVHVNDAFLQEGELRKLLTRDAVFLLPYIAATQSGALYSLLHAGRVMLCSDVGDLGDFMRRHDLRDLLLLERSARAVCAALDRLAADPEGIARRLARAQQGSRWDAALAAVRSIYFPS